MDGHKFWMFENWVQRRIFGSTRREVTGNWRELYNEMFNNLYFLTNLLLS
jgi:hypothetical protein